MLMLILEIYVCMIEKILTAFCVRNACAQNL